MWLLALFASRTSTAAVFVFESFPLSSIPPPIQTEIMSAHSIYVIIRFTPMVHIIFHFINGPFVYQFLLGRRATHHSNRVCVLRSSVPSLNIIFIWSMTTIIQVYASSAHWSVCALHPCRCNKNGGNKKLRSPREEFVLVFFISRKFVSYHSLLLLLAPSCCCCCSCCTYILANTWKDTTFTFQFFSRLSPSGTFPEVSPHQQSFSGLW